MDRIFDYNSPFIQLLNKAADCILLSLLWILSSLPIFTLGAASAALYSTVSKVILKEEGSIWKEYWHSFRLNFKQATLIFFILILAVLFLVFDILGLLQMAVNGKDVTLFGIVILVLSVFFIMWLHYIPAYIVHFYDSTKTVFKNTLILCVSNIARSFLLLLLFAAAVFLLFAAQFFSILPLLLTLFLPSGYALLCAVILEKIFRKYTDPQTDS